MKRKTTTRELNKVVTSFTIYKFIKDIITPFDKMKLFKDGKIDKNGKYLTDFRKIPTYDRLIVNIKKLLAKIPNPTTKAQLKHLTTALVLFTEETKHHGADPEVVFNEISDFLIENGVNIDDALIVLNEEMIANSVSSGGVYGARGNPDETLVNQIAHLKRMKLMKRKSKPTYFSVGSKASSD
jgi:hypothetical protein